MTLSPGTRVGPYEVISAIGKGGMGEVYRARDAKLQRDVALKVLPALFARDPERLARFEREARTLAALNHPHVAQVYGLVELPADAGSYALVLEFIDGEDLSERISRAGRIPIEDALPIALQVAQALEAAHEQGIVHRDLKPANIKVRQDGGVKVLDFGLAKALAPPDYGSGEAPARMENSPTITSPFQMSQMGVILGTAAYMAPEQAKGRPVDKRADIWAFGCVLFEMLTGTRPFQGEDVTDTLAAIVRGDPDWTQLPGDTPPHIRTLLRRCLEKDRRERLPDIGAARLELKESRPADVRQSAALAPASPRRTILPWVLFAVASLAAMAAVGYARVSRPAPDTRVYKSLIMPPAPLSGAPALRFRISPDGQRLAFIAPDEAGRAVLWIRPLDGLTAQPIAGTADAQSPFWSPDGRWLAFFADGKLKKVEVSSGAVISICDATAAPPGTWSAEGVILFTSASVIARVSAAGGKPSSATTLGTGEGTHISPWFLPDGRHFLYSVSAAGAQHPGIFVRALDSGESTRLSDQPSNASYASGYLLFLREATLMAQPFDPESRTLGGAAVPIAEGLQMNPSTGTGAYSVSDAGVLVYQTGAAAGTQLTWFDRAGKPQGSLGEPKGYRDVQLSPDGRFVSATIASSGSQGDVWLFDLARNLVRRFTFGGSTAAAPVWTPDGRDLVYAARRGGSTDLYRRAASGGGAEELLLHDDFEKLPLSISPDGQTLLYRVPRGAAAGELWLLPLRGERKPRRFSPGNASQTPAEVSPDGKWLAYVSDETSRREVYVTSYPDHVGTWQISNGSGDNPRWRADGKELFFTSNDRLMAVDILSSGDRFEPGAPRPLFPVRVPTATIGSRSTYAVTRDGQRFIVNTWDPRASVTPITLVVNWPASLK